MTLPDCRQKNLQPQSLAPQIMTQSCKMFSHVRTKLFYNILNGLKAFSDLYANLNTHKKRRTVSRFSLESKNNNFVHFLINHKNKQ